MGYKKFPYIDFYRSQVKPSWTRRPIHIRQPSTPSWHSRQPMKMTVEFPYGVVSYGVVSLTLPLVSVKLTSMVPTTFLRDILGVLNLWLKISLSGLMVDFRFYSSVILGIKIF